MFPLRICRYSMGKSMTEVLKMVKSVKFIKIKDPREARPPRDLTTKSARGGWDLPIFENLPGGCPGDGNAWN